jgi:hypothetical protein
MTGKPVNLKGKDHTDDPVIQKVIDAQAQLARLQRAYTAVKKDRDQLLDEYQDAKAARPVPKAPQRKKDHAAEIVRVYVGDVHGMKMDKSAVAAFLSDLKSIDPDEVVLGGDIVDCGGWLAKHQPMGYVAETDYSYQEDIAAGNWFLDEVQKATPRASIDFIEGNHEDRVERWVVDQVMAHTRDAEFLLEAFAPKSLLRLDERGINYYRRSVVYVDGLPPGWIKMGKMFMTHTLGTGKNAAQSALGKTAGNVTYWCTHREDTATAVLPGVGVVKAFNPGCLCMRQPLWRHSDPTNWSHGYGIDFIAPSGNFQRVHVPIWDGESLASTIISRFSS